MITASGDVLLRIDMKPGARLAAKAAALSAAGTTFELEPLFETPLRSAERKLAGSATSHAVGHLARATVPASESPWDTVREVAKRAAATGAASWMESPI